MLYNFCVLINLLKFSLRCDIWLLLFGFIIINIEWGVLVIIWIDVLGNCLEILFINFCVNSLIFFWNFLIVIGFLFSNILFFLFVLVEL